jgi:hypothetical protein
MPRGRSWVPLAARAHAAAGNPERAKAALQQVAADAGSDGALRLRDGATRELRRLGTRATRPRPGAPRAEPPAAS